MAKVSWSGIGTFLVSPLKQLEDGDWLVEALEHSARFVKGATLRVMQREFVDGPPSALPSASSSDQQVVVTETKPASAPEPVTPPPSRAKESQMRLSEKLKLAAAAASDLTASIERDADDILNTKAALDAQREHVMGGHKAMLTDAKVGLDEAAKSLALMSNQ